MIPSVPLRIFRKPLAAAILLFGAGAASAGPLPRIDAAAGAPPVLRVQASDPRVFQLEEQVRQLNGRIEELNFLVLELQEMLRKQQKDNEFRFQELEGQKQGAAPAPDAPDGTASAGDGAAGTGAPEKPLGTITFDGGGNATGAGATAAVPAGLGDAELFDSAYNLVLSGDYAAAEGALKEHAARYPKSERAADARYWLGETQLGQEKFTDAAESFLGVSRDFPQAERAPEALLKLGVSMAALKKNDIACATFKEVLRRYPDAAALKARVDTEMAAAQC